MRIWLLNIMLVTGFVSFGAELRPDDLPEQLLQPDSDLATDSEAADDLMPATLNTLGEDDSGNWVLKRVWWEKAEDAFGHIMAYNSQVQDQQQLFFSARHDLEKQLEVDRQKLGLPLEDLVKVVDHLLVMAGQAGNNLPENVSNQFVNTVVDNKSKLVALQAELNLMQKIDADQDSLMLQVVDQVQKCADYESKAWVDFKQIGRVLDDHKAQDLYQHVDSYQKNIQVVLKYLKGELYSVFTKYSQHATQKLISIDKMMQDLKGAGIDLGYEFKAMAEGAVQAPQPEVQKVAPKPVKSAGVWGMLANILSSLINLLLFLPKKLLGLVGIKF